MPDPLATLSPAREYEVDNVSGYLSDLAMEISNKSVEYDNTWDIWGACSKMSK